MARSGGADESKRALRSHACAARIVRRAAVGAIVAAMLAAAALPALLAARITQQDVTAVLRDWGGAELSWQDVDIDVFPKLRITLSGVHVLDRHLPRAVAVAAVPVAEISLETLPLLWGSFEADTLTLVNPEIHVQAVPAGSGDGVALRKLLERGGEGGRAGPDVVVLRDGTVRYTNRDSGVDRVLSAVDLHIGWDRDARIAALSGRFAVDGRILEVDAELEDPAQIFSTDGTRGRITAETLLPAGVERFHARGSFRLGAGSAGAAIDTLRISDASFVVGGTPASGGLTISVPGPRPRFHGSLAFEALDLSRYLQLWLPDTLTELLQRPVSARWLALADVDLALAADAVDLGAGRFGDVDVKLGIEAGEMALSVSRAAFADGNLEASLHVAVAGDGVAASASGRVREVSLAEAGAGLERARATTLIGTEAPPRGSGTGSFEIAAQGRTVAELAQSLSGWVVADVRDGSIGGADAVATLERVADGGAGIAEGHAPFIPIAGRTHFSRLSARLRTGSGVATLERLSLAGERFDIRVSGELDLTRGELFAEGSARLFDDTVGNGSHVLVELPFGVGGTVQDPMGAPGIPRRPEAEQRTAQHQPSVPSRSAAGGGPDVG